MSLRIFYDETDYRLKGWRQTAEIIRKILEKENKVLGELLFIITIDKKVRELNVQFLEHDYNTDVIAFSNSDGEIINGEIYISIDTVRRNSINYEVSLKEEVLRVMIHGVLHLVGYDDKTEDQRVEMKSMEDYWLRLNERKANGF